MKKNKGFMMLDVMFALIVFGIWLAFRASIDLKDRHNESVLGLSRSISSVMYAMDKRILIDGPTMSSSLGGATVGGGDSFQKMIELFVASGNASCGVSTGWTPSDPVNSSMALIPCTVINPSKLPFDFNMDTHLDVVGGLFQSYKVDFYHDSDAVFKDNFSVYSELLKAFDSTVSPQITSSHRALLVNRTTDEQIAAPECLALGVDCGVRYEVFTNDSGISGDVYLRINGDNMMLDSIKFRGVGVNPAECMIVSESGVETPSDCGLDYDRATEKLDLLSDTIYAKELRVTGDDTSGITSNPLCRSSTSNASRVCGITRIRSGSTSFVAMAAHYGTFSDIKSQNSITQINSSGVETFNVDSSGKVTALNKIQSKFGAGSEQSYLGAYGVYSRDGGDSVTVKNNLVEFNGTMPHYRSESSTHNDNYNRGNGLVGSRGFDSSELASKRYIHSFEQIVDVRTVQSNSNVTKYRCPAGTSHQWVLMPANSIMTESYTQTQKVCPFSWGYELPSVTTTLAINTHTTEELNISATTSQSVRCSSKGDYLNIWYQDDYGSYATIRSYLLGPRPYSGSTSHLRLTNTFTVMQICSQM